MIPSVFNNCLLYDLFHFFGYCWATASGEIYVHHIFQAQQSTDMQPHASHSAKSSQKAAVDLPQKERTPRLDYTHQTLISDTSSETTKVSSFQGIINCYGSNHFIILHLKISVDTVTSKSNMITIMSSIPHFLTTRLEMAPRTFCPRPDLGAQWNSLKVGWLLVVDRWLSGLIPNSRVTK